MVNPTWLGTFAGAAGTAIVGVGGFLFRERRLKLRDEMEEEWEPRRRKGGYKDEDDSTRILFAFEEFKNYMAEQTEVMRKISNTLEMQNMRADVRHNELILKNNEIFGRVSELERRSNKHN